MASWREKMRPSSFRGVPFEVKAREGETGRRGPDFEFPDRDDGYAKDLGKKLRRYKVDAFLLASRLGGDYLPAKNKLLEALEKKGPGEYIDQWGDAWQVQVRGVTWRESVEDGGYVSFAITFVEHNAKAGHTVTADTGHAVGLAADKAGTALVDDFAGTFSARGNAQVEAGALDLADQALGDLNTMLAGANLSANGGKVPGVLAQLASARTNAASLVASPANLAASIRNLMSLSLGSLSSGWPRYRAAQGLTSYGAGLPAIAPTTTMRAQAAANQAAMVNLVRGLATVEAAQASAEIPFAVYDEAVVVRDQVAASLDGRMLAAPDPVYQSLDTLRAASVRDITMRGADLSRLAQVTNDADTPALVLAHRLYGDADRAADVVERNPAIRHPGFIPGGLTLKVPTDA